MFLEVEMKEWLKQFGTQIIGWLLHWGGPRLIAYFLSKIRPGELADALRPHLRALMAKMGPDYQEQLYEAFRKLYDFIGELMDDSNIGT